MNEFRKVEFLFRNLTRSEAKVSPAGGELKGLNDFES
jgi:hypothetical protein